MKGKWGKAVSILLILAMVTSGGCGSGGGQKTAPEDAGSAAESTAAAETSEAVLSYNGNDLSERKSLVMYVIGDKPVDADMVITELNKLTEEELNASLEIKYMSLSDYTTKYSLLMTSGEKFDLIYTSTWAFYTEEATKGAFAEITDEILEKYMPLTLENQDPVSFEQAKVQDKMYFVTKNSATISNGNPVLIRGDLREKYGLDPIDSVEDLEAYYDAVVNSREGLFPYAAAGDNTEMRHLMFHAYNNNFPIALIRFYSYFYKDGQMQPEDIKWTAELPEYAEFCKRMKAWADKGYWSQSAVVNTISPRDAFENGTAASLVWNLDTLEASSLKVMEYNPEWKPEVVDVTPEAIRIKGSYSGDGMAVFANSENKERAFMLLDKLKYDEKYYDLARYGVEGTHWIDNGDGTWKAGSGQANFPVGNATSWGLKNDMFEKSLSTGESDTPSAKESILAGATYTGSASGFTFDDSKVKNELAAMNEVYTKYVPLLELGLVDDVDATLKEYNDAINLAGREAVEKELLSQFEAFVQGKE